MIVIRIHSGGPDLGPPLCISAPEDAKARFFRAIGVVQTSTPITAGRLAATVQVTRDPRPLPDRQDFAIRSSRA